MFLQWLKVLHGMLYVVRTTTSMHYFHHCARKCTVFWYFLTPPNQIVGTVFLDHMDHEPIILQRLIQLLPIVYPVSYRHYLILVTWILSPFTCRGNKIYCKVLKVHPRYKFDLYCNRGRSK